MTHKYWAIVPAAGSGSRFQNTISKQYYVIHGKTVLEHSIRALLASPLIQQVVVAVSPHDTVFATLPIAHHPKVLAITGGENRMASVNNALSYLKTQAEPSDWVLVHDAVRPALHDEDLDNLIETVQNDSVGGILASPVQDTIKFSQDENRIAHTVSREPLWSALTPQLFRFEILQEGMRRSEQIGLVATDEAQVVEQIGKLPLIVKAKHANPKLTYPDDELYISYIFTSRMSKIEKQTSEAVCE